MCACVHSDTRGTCPTQMTPMSVWVSPSYGWCMDHVVQSARAHTGSIALGSSKNVAPQFALSEGMVHLLSTAFRGMRGAEEECARPTPCRQNQVLSVWLGTLPSISPVHFSLPRIKPMQGNTSAPTTCRQDKGLRMAKFCHVCLTCKRSSDNVFITTCNWFGLTTIKRCCDKMRYCCSTSSFIRICFHICALFPTEARAATIQVKSWYVL